MPSLRFVRRHVTSAEPVPRPPTAAAHARPAQVRGRCACGWVGPARDSVVVAAGDGQDHVQSAWLAHTGKG